MPIFGGRGSRTRIAEMAEDRMGGGEADFQFSLSFISAMPSSEVDRSEAVA